MTVVAVNLTVMVMMPLLLMTMMVMMPLLLMNVIIVIWTQTQTIANSLRVKSYP